jgi:hypothetical protein
MVGRPPKVFPKSIHDCGEVFRLSGSKPDGTVELQSLGSFQEVNGKRYGTLHAYWLNEVQRIFPPFDTRFSDRLEQLLHEYIRERAEESAAVAWDDLLAHAIEIDAAAKALLAALGRSAPSTSLIWQRLKSIEGPDWSRDDCYPGLSQLTRRSHLLLNELRQERARGEALEIGAAWKRCVFGFADIYLDMTGEEPSATEINKENKEISRHSRFSILVAAAINQLPLDIRLLEFANGMNIDSLPRKMRDHLQAWKRSRGFPPKRIRKAR